MDAKELALTPERIAKQNHIFSQPQTLDILCGHVANGGSPMDFAGFLDVRYSDMMEWIYKDEQRNKRYQDALKSRSEWFVMSLLKELKELSLSDIREAFDENNKLKPMDKWPEGLAKCIEAVKVDELYDDDKKNIGRTVQVKLWNKPKAIEMLGKHLKLFTDIIEVSKQTTLEDLIVGTRSEYEKKNSGPD